MSLRTQAAFSILPPPLLSPIIILVGEVAVGLLLGFDESSYKDVITNSVEATVMKKYHNNTTATVQTFDLIQEGVKKSLLVFSFNIKKNIFPYLNHFQKQLV